jgi:hypothetical protein
MAGVAFFAAAMVALHLLHWHDPPRHVSNYTHLRGGWLWDLGLAGLGFGTYLLVAGLRRSVPLAAPANWAWRGLEVAGIMILGMIVFPTDRNLNPDHPTTVSGFVHDSFAVLSTFFICWSMLLLVASARLNPGLALFGRTWWWPIGTIGASLAWMGGDVTEYWPLAAVVQRLVVILIVAWLMTVAWRARLAHATGMPQPVPPPRPTR